MQSFDSYLYGSQSFFLTVINILWNSSSRRTSELNSNLSRNVSLHNSEIICIRFVTGIPGILLIYFFLKFCSPEMSLIKDFLLKIINFINLRAFMYPVFLAGNLISVTAHIDEVIYDFPNGITLTFLTISSFSCNIYICYELNDFLFYFAFLLMSL